MSREPCASRWRAGRAVRELLSAWPTARGMGRSRWAALVLALRAFAWGWQVHGCVCGGTERGLDVVHTEARCWDELKEIRERAEADEWRDTAYGA